jgi:hypothetical protein
VADLSSIAYDALKTAVEHVAGKLKEGKKLSTEDIFLLYLGTIADELKDTRKELTRLNARIDETNKRIDEVNKRIDALTLEVQKQLAEVYKRIDETNKRIDELTLLIQRQFTEVHRRVDETNKRIDEISRRMNALQTTLLEIQKLLVEVVRKSG